MARASRMLLTAFVIAAMAIGALVYLSVRDRDSTAPAQSDTSEIGQVVRENSHRLNSVPESKVTFVEFLDFECEGCRAVYPEIEKLRAEYGDRVNFVIRHFPLPAHVNAERAARAGLVDPEHDL
ncbi:DsbA family protein, partial [Streptomyces sp. DSM 41534]